MWINTIKIVRKHCYLIVVGIKKPSEMFTIHVFKFMTNSMKLELRNFWKQRLKTMKSSKSHGPFQMFIAR